MVTTVSNQWKVRKGTTRYEAISNLGSDGAAHCVDVYSIYRYEAAEMNISAFWLAQNRRSRLSSLGRHQNDFPQFHLRTEPAKLSDPYHAVINVSGVAVDCDNAQIAGTHIHLSKLGLQPPSPYGDMDRLRALH